MAIPDQSFFDRADEHIRLSNEQMADVTRGKVSASMLYATARFNAWVTACGFSDGAAMRAQKRETVEYFVTEYRKMLEENLDDYADHFDKYMSRAT